MRPLCYFISLILLSACAEPPDAPPKTEKNPFSATVNPKAEANKYQVHLVWEDVPDNCQIFKASEGQEMLLTKIERSSGAYDDEALKPKTAYIYKLVDDGPTTLHSVIVYIPEDLEIHGVIEAKALTANRLFLSHAQIFYQGEIKVEAKEIHSEASEIRLLPPGPFSHLSEVSPAFRRAVNARLQGKRFQDHIEPAHPLIPDFNTTPSEPGVDLGNPLGGGDYSRYFRRPSDNFPIPQPFDPILPSPLEPILRHPLEPILPVRQVNSRPARNAGVISIKADRAYGNLALYARGDDGVDGQDGSPGLTGKQGPMGTHGLSKRVETTTTPPVPSAKKATPKPQPKPNPITTVTIECAENPTDGGAGEPGSAGSPGEDGKPGGDSATVDVQISQKTEFRVDVHSEPGLGGQPGKGGPGGDGGPGGMADPFPAMGCRQAKPGPQGPRGTDGHDGNEGKAGVRQPVSIKVGT